MSRLGTRQLLPLLALVSLGSGPGWAEPDRPTQLAVEPAAVTLRGPWDRQQLLVTGHDGPDTVRDLTPSATFTALAPEVVAVTPGGVVAPRGRGQTVVVVRVGTHEVCVPVTVETVDPAVPVSFQHEVIPALTKAGCNAGACHGTPQGKNGFRLSLRGYDPGLDHHTLTREAAGRRVNPLAPDASLLLLKATARVPHEGGKRFDPDSDLYALLRAWVAQGARDDAETAAQLVRLDVSPARRILDAPAAAQQLRVIAHFADGRACDVTHLARYSVNDEAVAAVDVTGRVTRRQRGEVAVAVEYLGAMATARVIFRDADPGFVWPDPPEHNAIDRHVFAKLRLLQIEPSPLCRDDEFIRRAYLDAIGRLPTPDEVRRFLADPDPQKRDRLIDALLERPEFADWWALKWADRLGCNQRFVGKIGALKYHQWIKQAMAENLPEDEFARAIITATGPNYEHPPAGFYRRLRDPQVRAEEIAQLFMGVRMQCARCHNHPGERWTQDDYYGLAAFFARLKYKDGPFFVQQYDKEETVYAVREGDVVHPRTGRVVAPKFPGGAAVPLAADANRPEVFARWLTAADNPFFARAAVNRIWFHLFGRGIIDPVDDLRGTNPPVNDELLDFLAADFIASGYDRKRMVRLIMKSRTYQLSSLPTPHNEHDSKYFSHYPLRRLQAEQLLDAICDVTGVPEKYPGFPLGTRAVQLPDGEFKHPFLNVFGRPPRAMACECERDTDTTLTQALHLVGALPFQEKLRSPDSRVARVLAAGRSDREIVEEFFLAALARWPTPAELKLCLAHLAQAGPAGRREAAEDILYALLNHREFLFQH
jgi:hypothetical protein